MTTTSLWPINTYLLLGPWLLRAYDLPTLLLQTNRRQLLRSQRYLQITTKAYNSLHNERPTQASSQQGKSTHANEYSQTHTLPKTGVHLTTTMRQATKNSKKDEASSDDSTVHLETINEDDLPEVTGTRNFKTGRGLEPFASLGISFDPDMLANLEEFTPHQESFLTTLLEGTTSRLIHVHQTALQVQQEEIQRLQTHMRDMQDKMNETRPLTSMETPRAIRPQDVEYQSLLNTAKKLKQESQQEERHRLQNSHVYGNDNNDMAGTMQAFLANMSSVLKNNNKHKDSVTELPKFQGADTLWPNGTIY